MSNVRTKNGKVLLINGKVNCECCVPEEEDLLAGDGLAIDFLEAGTCNCDTVACYRGPSNLSPATVVAGGITWTNRTPGTVRFTPDIPSAAVGGASGFYLQYPRFVVSNSGAIEYIGYRNLVSQPTLTRLTGSIGGDIQLNIRALVEPQTWDSTLNLDNFVPQEGEFPCGRPETCPIIRNGPHQVDYLIILFPNMFFYIEPFSYVTCFPYFNLRLRRVDYVSDDISGAQCYPPPP